eukprot:2605313-Rhodomonas_salina.2
MPLSIAYASLQCEMLRGVTRGSGQQGEASCPRPPQPAPEGTLSLPIALPPCYAEPGTETAHIANRHGVGATTCKVLSSTKNEGVRRWPGVVQVVCVRNRRVGECRIARMALREDVRVYRQE